MLFLRMIECAIVFV